MDRTTQHESSQSPDYHCLPPIKLKITNREAYITHN